jgi:DNA (cytosine-5)-methyltransferase 1
MKFIDLFAGIGGFRYGLERCNWGITETSDNENRQKQPDNNRSDGKGRGSDSYTCVYSNEWDKYAAQIYNKNFSNQIGGEQPREERKYKRDHVHTKSIGEATYNSDKGIDTRDIRTVKSSEIPDFDLLVGGFPCQAFSIAGKRKGFDDTRGTLFFEIARILADKRPRYFILENVKGLLSHDEGKTFQTILGVLSDLGYEFEWQVLNSKNFGVPQNRERVFIIGNLRGEPRPKVFPVRGGGGKTKDLVYAQKSDREISRIYDTTGLAPTLHLKTGGWQEPKISKDMKIRRLTPTECERLQGFPDGWTEGISDTQRYKCLGNAVTTNVVSWIGEHLK